MTQLEPVHLLILAIATWRISFMLVKEDGPFGVLLRLRTALHGAGGLLTCMYCLSVWAAVGMVGLWLLGGAGQVIVLVLALSGGALMLAVYTGANHGA